MDKDQDNCSIPAKRKAGVRRTVAVLVIAIVVIVGLFLMQFVV